MQRLFLIWSALAAFAGAIVLGSPRVSGANWTHTLVLAALAGGLLWSASEARKLAEMVRRTRNSPEQTRLMEGPNNSELGRYPYASFATSPGYASHGYMDAWFENRLLDAKSRQPFLTNADAAAPGDGPTAGYSKLISEGLLTAENITQSTSYFLRPTLTLDPGKRYALRLGFFEPETQGVLQLMHETMFREYLLPDSGVGIGRSGPPRAFGTEPTSGRVLSLGVLGNEPAPIKAILITPRPTHRDFTAGRYWLYTYERSQLPIVVESWIPYRVRFTSPRAAFLESPRMWLKDWRASVNGRAVPAERSPEGLVMVPVQAGPNIVTLEYVPPAIVRVSFWVFLGSWVAAAGAALGWLSGAAPPRSARLSACLAAVGRHKFLLLGAAVAAVAVLYVERRRSATQGLAGTAGPIEGRFNLPREADVAKDFGPVHMILMLPSQKTGRNEPLLTTGRTGAGDVIYVFYEDSQHIRVGFDHWSFPGKLSDPIAVDYTEPHEIWVLEGTLFPALGDDAKWGATTPATRMRLKSLVAVMVDGKPVFSGMSATYPSAAAEVTLARNSIGASTADAEFSGVVSYAERTGTFVPPGLGP